mgnify:CR=1 FL=1
MQSSVMRTLGLDIGSVRIGVAISDDRGRLALPLQTVDARPRTQAIAALASLIDEHGIEDVVVGWPIELDGRAGHAVRKTQRLVDALTAATDVAIHRWDERLTSVAAARALVGGDVRRRRRKEVIDQVAASLILQGWLDARAR